MKFMNGRARVNKIISKGEARFLFVGQLNQATKPDDTSQVDNNNFRVLTVMSGCLTDKVQLTKVRRGELMLLFKKHFVKWKIENKFS